VKDAGAPSARWKTAADATPRLSVIVATIVIGTPSVAVVTGVCVMTGAEASLAVADASFESDASSSEVFTTR
jgi:hypothetical protein